VPQAFRLIPSLLVLCTTAWLAVGSYNFLRGNKSLQTIIKFLLLPFVLSLLTSTNPYYLSSSSPDLVIYLLYIIITILLVQFFASKKNDTLYLIILLSILGVTIKLSFAVFALFSIIVVILLKLKEDKLQVLKESKLILFSVVFLGWMDNKSFFFFNIHLGFRGESLLRQ
jgi:hypothetical protein